MLDPTRAMFGLEVEICARRAAVAVRLEAAAMALARLDELATGHRFRGFWLMIERVYAIAAGARAASEEIDAATVFRLLAGGRHPEASVDLIGAQERWKRWHRLRRRSEHGDLLQRIDAIALAAPGAPSLLRVAAGVGREAMSLRMSRGALSVDAKAKLAEVSGGVGEAFDRGDIAFATSYALQRVGLVQRRVPSICPPPQTLILGQGDELDRLGRWLDATRRQADEARGRLEAIDAYLETAWEATAATRRRDGLRAVIRLAFTRWSVWASDVAGALGVSHMTAWRWLADLKQAGLLVEIADRTYQGRAGVMVLPVVAAELVPGGELAPVSRLTRRSEVRIDMEEISFASVDAAMADLDRLLGISFDAEDRDESALEGL